MPRVVLKKFILKLNKNVVKQPKYFNFVNRMAPSLGAELEKDGGRNYNY
jgi:hypothetical protein